MQRLKAEKPEEFRCLVKLGEHKKHLDENEELGNPYEEEIKAFDGLVKSGDTERVLSLRVPEETQKYGLLDETPLTIVDTVEVLEQVA